MGGCPPASQLPEQGSCWPQPPPLRPQFPLIASAAALGATGCGIIELLAIYKGRLAWRVLCLVQFGEDRCRRYPGWDVTAPCSPWPDGRFRGWVAGRLAHCAPRGGEPDHRAQPLEATTFFPGHGPALSGGRLPKVTRGPEGHKGLLQEWQGADPASCPLLLSHPSTPSRALLAPHITHPGGKSQQDVC